MNTTDLHLWSAWSGVLAGMASGAVMGLMFHRDDWLGGYNSWPRRMLRLGHISCFGIAFLNFAFAVTLMAAAKPLHAWASPLLLAGAILMPAVCVLAAWKKALRHMFPLPVVCLAGAVTLIIGSGV